MADAGGRAAADGRMPGFAAAFAFAAALVALVWVAGLDELQFETIAVLAERPLDGTAGEDGWRSGGAAANGRLAEGRVALVPATPTRSSLTRTFALPGAVGPGDFVRVGATVRCDGTANAPAAAVSAPAASAQAADEEVSLFATWFVDGAGERLDVAPFVEIDCSRKRSSGTKTMPVPRAGFAFEVALLQRRFEAGYELSALNVTALRHPTAYHVLVAGTAFAAAIGATLGAVSLRRRFGAARVGGVASLLGVLLGGAVLGTASMRQVARPLYEALGLPLGRWGQPELEPLLVLGHVLMFAAITTVLFAVLRAAAPDGARLPARVATLRVLGITALLGALTEGLQSHRVDRNAELGDLSIDAVGVALGAALYVLLATIRHHHRARRCAGETR